MEILKETLNWSYNIKTSKAHIITIKGHENSEKMAARCLVVLPKSRSASRDI